MSSNISNRQLNISSAGQIALNLDKKDGQDGIISQSVWEEFWKTNDSESKYKGRKEAEVGQNGISVRDAMKLIMTRIFNAANSLGEEVNQLGDKWLNGIENKEQIDANTIDKLKNNTENTVITQNHSDVSQTSIDETGVHIIDTSKQKFGSILNQVKDTLLEHIDEFDLDQNTKNDLTNRLREFDVSKIPENAKSDDISFVDAACMLLSKMLPSAGQGYNIVAKLIQIDNRFEDTVITNKSAPASIQGKKISEVAEAVSQNSEEKIKKLYTNAQKELVSYLQSNPDKKFKSPYDSNREISTSELLKYVQNMKFRSDNYGSAQAYDFTPDDSANERNGILVNTNKFCANPYATQNEVIKNLIHESLHCAFSIEHFPFNNQKEEMYCERQAIQLTSEILKGKIDNSSIYGHNFTELGNMSEEELTQLLEIEFINKGYEHRPKDLEGNVNINGYEIHAGDTVTIDGQPVGNVGKNGCILDQLDEQQIYLMGQGGGRVVFAQTQPQNSKTIIIKRGTQDVMTAYIIPMQ